MRGSKDMENDLDGMLESVETRVKSYISTNELSDDDFLFLEALIARAIDFGIGFANLKKKVKIGALKEIDSKTSEEISRDVNYILGDLSERIDAYFDEMAFDDDETLVFRSLISEKIEQFFVKSMLDKERRRVACHVDEMKERLGVR